MRGTRTPDGLPLRPLTFGELLDAAVSLLRTHAGPLLLVAVPLAVLEQLALMPLRAGAGMRPPWFGPAENGSGDWWAIAALGFGIEAVIITLLGAVAAAAAGPALLGTDVRGRALWRRVRPVSAITAAIVTGLVAALAVLCFFIPWLFLYGLLGLVAPVLVTDRVRNPFSALGRSMKLTASREMRGSWIRVGGYASWFMIRLAMGAGWVSVLETFTSVSAEWLVWASAAAWLIADVLAYAALGCLDAVLHLEIRIRVEGLDLDIGQARRAGRTPTLEVRR